jgi:hypothetical protein
MKYICHICSKEYYSESRYHNHIKLRHSDDNKSDISNYTMDSYDTKKSIRDKESREKMSINRSITSNTSKRSDISKMSENKNSPYKTTKPTLSRYLTSKVNNTTNDNMINRLQKDKEILTKEIQKLENERNDIMENNQNEISKYKFRIKKLQEDNEIELHLEKVKIKKEYQKLLQDEKDKILSQNDTSSQDLEIKIRQYSILFEEKEQQMMNSYNDKEMLERELNLVKKSFENELIEFKNVIDKCEKEKIINKTIIENEKEEIKQGFLSEIKKIENKKTILETQLNLQINENKKITEKYNCEIYEMNKNFENKILNHMQDNVDHLEKTERNFKTQTNELENRYKKQIKELEEKNQNKIKMIENHNNNVINNIKQTNEENINKIEKVYNDEKFKLNQQLKLTEEFHTKKQNEINEENKTSTNNLKNELSILDNKYVTETRNTSIKLIELESVNAKIKLENEYLKEHQQKNIELVKSQFESKTNKIRNDYEKIIKDRDESIIKVDKDVKRLQHELNTNISMNEKNSIILNKIIEDHKNQIDIINKMNSELNIQLKNTEYKYNLQNIQIIDIEKELEDKLIELKEQNKEIIILNKTINDHILKIGKSELNNESTISTYENNIKQTIRENEHKLEQHIKDLDIKHRNEILKYEENENNIVFKLNIERERYNKEINDLKTKLLDEYKVNLQSVISNYTEKIDNLNEIVSRYKNEIITRDSKSESSEKEIKTSLDNLQKKYKEECDKSNEYSNRIKEKVKIINDMKQLINNLNIEISQLKSDTTLLNKIKELQIEIADSANKFKVLQKEFENFKVTSKDELRENININSKKDSEIKNNQIEIQSLNDKLKSLTNNYDEQIHLIEIDHKRKIISIEDHYKTQIKSKDEHIEVLSNKTNKVINEYNEKLKDKENNYNREIIQLSNDYKEKIDNNNIINNQQLKVKDNTILKLEENITINKTEYENKQKEMIINHEKELELKTEKLSKLQNEFQTNINNLTNDIKQSFIDELRKKDEISQNLQTEIMKNKSEVDYLIKNHELQLKYDSNEDKNKIKDLEQCILVCRSQIENMEKTNRSLINNINETRQDFLIKLEVQENENKKINDDKQTNISNLEYELINIKNELDKSVNHYQSIIKENNERNVYYNEVINEKEKSIIMLNHSIDIKQNEIKKLNEEYEILNVNYNIVISDQTLLKQKETLQLKINEHENTISILRSELNVKNSMLNKARNDLKDFISSSETNKVVLDKLKTDIRERDDKLKVLNESVSSSNMLSKQNYNSIFSINSKQNEIIENEKNLLVKQIAKLETENKSIINNYEIKLDKKERSFEEIKNELNQLKDTLNDKNREILNVKDNYEKETINLQNKYKLEQNKLIELQNKAADPTEKQKLIDSQSQMKKMRDETIKALDKQKLEINSLKEEHSKCILIKTQLEQLSDKKEVDINNLTNKINELNQLIETKDKKINYLEGLIFKQLEK